LELQVESLIVAVLLEVQIVHLSFEEFPEVQKAYPYLKWGILEVHLPLRLGILEVRIVHLIFEVVSLGVLFAEL
jgi:hypothetical protein